MLKKYLKFTLPALVFILFIIAEPASALEPLTSGLNCLSDGKCSLNDVMLVAINIANFIMGVSGAAALLAFVYGGIILLISSGNQNQVTKGKNILIGAVIGLVIIFVSYTIVGFVFNVLDVPYKENWASSNWFNK